MNATKKDGRSWRTKPIVDGEKHCYKCDQWKPVADFYGDKRAATGYRARCKRCDIDLINARHTNNLERALRSVWIRHKTNGRVGSKRRKDFTDNGCVTPEVLLSLWDEQEGKCAVTGRKMTHVQGQGKVMTNVTLDRIDNDKGYTKDNIRLVCRAANFIKSMLSDAEMLDWCRAVLDGPLNK